MATVSDDQLKALLGKVEKKWPGKTISYSFFDGGPYDGTEEVGEVSNNIKKNVRSIIENYIEPLINVNFIEVSDAGNNYSQLRYMLSSGYGEEFNAYTADLPGTSASCGDVHLNPNNDHALTPDGFQGGPGTYGFKTLIHETLHALGLKHPGDYNGNGKGESPFLPGGEDNNTNTVMTYNLWDTASTLMPQASTLMPYDIKALQHLYGAKAHNTGNTTYTFDTVYGFGDGNRYWGSPTNQTKAAIWDSGGTDTLNFSKLAYNAWGYRFDLNQGGMSTTQYAYNGTEYKAKGDSSKKDYKTTTYGTAIAYDVTIENAIGTSSNDEMLGNSADNILQGGSGNDDLSAGGGHDTILGGSGNDNLLGGSGNDKLVGYSDGTEYDVLTGGTGKDTFVLGDSSNAFYQGDDYARITDFNWKDDDSIQVKGTASQYSLETNNWFGSSALDTAIFLGNDAIGVVQDSTNVNLTRDFVFV